MGVFANKLKLNEAKLPSQGGVYFRPLRTRMASEATDQHPAVRAEYSPGSYVAEVDTIRIFKSRKKQEFYLVETKILESNVPELVVGSRVSWMPDLDKDSTPGNIKSLLIALSGLDVYNDAAAIAAEDWDKLFEASLADEEAAKAKRPQNIFRGKKVRVEAALRLKKDHKPNLSILDPMLDTANHYTYCQFKAVGK